MSLSSATGRKRVAPWAVFLVIVMLPAFVPDSGEPKNKGEATQDLRVPILVYHRFGPVASDSMTVTTQGFESHVRYLAAHGYSVIKLRELVDRCLGKEASLPSRPVVITVDDGHRSVYTDLQPILKKYRIPVTLFLYPSALSNASYAMTWNQVREVKGTGLVDLQSHTYWHPNFKNEKKRLTAAEYEKFVRMQLGKSKERLEKELDVTVNLLAWPFGIYDDGLMSMAARAGYVAALSIERHHAGTFDPVMALPRYLIGPKDHLSSCGL